MHKELIIAATSQETKLAILENDELVEYLIERRRSEGIVGNIYKGRVTKVLPGMQSAFVDIGLERDAFLYVSDFLEDADEYDKIVSTAEDEVVASLDVSQQPAARQAPPPPVAPPPAAPTVDVPPAFVAPPLPPPSIAGEFELELDIEPEEAATSAPSIPGAPAPTASELLAGEVRTGLAPNLPTGVPPEGEMRSFDPTGERRDRGPRERDRGPRDRDRNDRGGRDRGRDRRGKTPKIPSFESRTYEPRAEEGPFGTLEVIPGETLRKYTNRPPAPPTAPADEEEQARPAEPSFQSPELDAVQPETPVTRETPETPEAPESDQPNSSARITDKSDNSFMAHRPQQRRGGRRRGGPGGPGGPNGGDRGDRGGDRPTPRPDEPRSGGGGHYSKSGPLIADLLREGQEILVQVSKEPLGKKGARITSHIALPGRYLVYMPTVDHIGVSRKIASDEERQRLKRVINENRTGLPGGFIVRTAAEGRAETEFVNDIRFLGNLWSDIRAKSEKKSGPALIHSDLTLVQRMLRDQLTEEFKAIRIDNEQEFATILDFVNKFQPALVNRVKLHVKDTPIFEEFGLNAEIDKALKSKVWLKSGGYIVINQTEALVAIDINTGKYVGKSNRLEDTITRTNVDAVHEIVRQIRLRNLGGIIVVDFIDMEERKNRQKVMAALEEELRSDRVPSKILQFNDFGLVAITRKRTQASLERTICRPCDYCTGSGWVKSPETVCYEIQSELRKMSSLLEGKEITVRVNPEVAKVLKSGEFVSLIDMEEMLKKDIVVKSDPLLHKEHFDIF
jgi:Rne/Rng family ribonuclease